MARARRRTLSPPGRSPSRGRPRSMQSSITCQIRSSPASSSARGRPSGLVGALHRGDATGRRFAPCAASRRRWRTDRASSAGVVALGRPRRASSRSLGHDEAAADRIVGLGKDAGCPSASKAARTRPLAWPGQRRPVVEDEVACRGIEGERRQAGGRRCGPSGRSSVERRSASSGSRSRAGSRAGRATTARSVAWPLPVKASEPCSRGSRTRRRPGPLASARAEQRRGSAAAAASAPSCATTTGRCRS